MVDNNSQESLLHDTNRDQEHSTLLDDSRSLPSLPSRNEEHTPLLDDSRSLPPLPSRDEELTPLLDYSRSLPSLPSTILREGNDLYGRHGRGKGLDRVTIIVLFGWILALVAFLTYTFAMRGKIFNQNPWETYRVITQILGTFSMLLAVLFLMREGSHTAKTTAASDQETDHNFEFGVPSSTCSLESVLRFLKVVAAFAVVLWISHPGENGLLQVVTSGVQYAHSNVTIQYNYLSEVDMGRTYALCCNGLYSEYSRLLLSQGEYLHAQSDMYGNVKIPDLARLKSYTEDDDEWTAIQPDGGTIYSSILGVPVSGIPIRGNTTFTIESSYYYITCDNVTYDHLQKYWIIKYWDAVEELPVFDGPFSETNTTFGLDSTGSLSVATAGFQGLRWPQRWQALHSNSSSDSKGITEVEAQPLLVQSSPNGDSIRSVREWDPNNPFAHGSSMVTAYCRVQTHYVSVKITCTPSACAATSMRPSQILHPNINLTDLGNIRAFYELTSDFMIAGLDGHANVEGEINNGNTLTEYFLQNPYFGSKPEDWIGYGPYHNHPLSTPEQFGIRLQMALNGFRMLGTGGTTVKVYKEFSSIKLTTGDNVTEESVVVMLRLWKLMAIMFLSISLVVYIVTRRVSC